MITLSETGPIHLTQAAVDAYQRHTGSNHAREELEALVAAATPYKDSTAGHEQWRHRSRSTGLDILCHVVRDDGGPAVTHCRVRDYGGRTRK